MVLRGGILVVIFRRRFLFQP